MGILDRVQNVTTRLQNGLLPGNYSGGLLNPQQDEGIRKRAMIGAGANLLQNAGPSLVPQSTIRNIGEAISGGQQIQAGLTSQALQDQLMASQSARNAAYASNESGAANRNVQSTFIGDNGNMWIIRRDGSPEDTGIKVQGDPFSVQQIELEDGRKILGRFDRQSGALFDLAGNQIVAPVRSVGGSDVPSQPITMQDRGVSQITGLGVSRSPEEEAAAVRSAQSQSDRAESVLEEAPKEIQTIESEIERNEKTLEALEGGNVQTGFFQGRVPAQFMGSEDEEFEVFSGKEIISAISSATFGQLSEGEREFLSTTVPSRTKTEEANKEIIRERLRILRKAKAIEEGRLRGVGGDVPVNNDPLGIRNALDR